MPLLDAVTDHETGEIRPVVVVTDNGGPFRSFRFEAYIAARSELRHVRTRVRSPGQNGVRERAFGSLKYELLYREQIADATELERHTPRRSGSSSTRSDRTKRSPGTGRSTSTRAAPSRRPPPFNAPKSCQFLDAG